MPGGSRSLPDRPSLRFLKLEAKRRLAAGEFTTLHDAQAAIAREHGLPNWAGLKQACALRPEPESPEPESPEPKAQNPSWALDQLRWVISRFSAADAPGWTAPGEDELRQHFDDRFLAVIPAGTLVEQASKMAADLRAELVVISAAPLEAHIQLADLRYIAAADAEPPHRLIGLRGFPLGARITDPRVKAPPPPRTLGEPSGEIVGLAEQSRAELGLPALLLAGGQPGRTPWVVASGLADLDRAEPLEASHRFPVPGVTALVTATAVLRLVGRGPLRPGRPRQRSPADGAPG